jgi:hypothetical protein
VTRGCCYIDPVNISQIEALGEHIRSQYLRANYDEQQLPDIAARALREADIESSLDLAQIADFLVETRCKQQPGSIFGDLPPVLYRCKSFYIELLIWTTSTTAVHQHGFSGAFRVFAGSSLHSVYDFEEKSRVNSRILIGTNSFQKAELLQSGDVRSIRSGRQGLLHSLFHLEHPSATLVVRNNLEPWALPQYSLIGPNLAFAASELRNDGRVQLLARLLSVAATIDPKKPVELFHQLARTLDFARLFELVRQRYPLLQETDEDWQGFLKAARDRHGDLSDHFESLVAVMERERSIVNARRSVRDPELRFFLALILNVPSRAELLRLVEQRFPNEDPHTLCRRWLAKLSDKSGLARAFQELASKAQLSRDYQLTRRLGAALSFAKDDPRTKFLLGALIDGASADELTRRLKEKGEDFGEDVGPLQEAYARLREIAELQALSS